MVRPKFVVCMLILNLDLAFLGNSSEAADGIQIRNGDDFGYLVLWSSELGVVFKNLGALPITHNICYNSAHCGIHITSTLAMSGSSCVTLSRFIRGVKTGCLPVIVSCR